MGAIAWAVPSVGAAGESFAQNQPQPAALSPPVLGFPVGWCIRANTQAFADAKAAGFEYVELALQDVLGLTDAELQTLAAQLSAHGLRALSGYNPIPSDLKLVGPEIDRTKQEAHIRHLLARAAALELTFVILNSGASWRVPEGFPADEAFSQLAAFGRQLAAAASQHGMTVLVEPLRGTDSNMITTVGDALRLINAVNHPSFELMVDYSFLTIQKEDPSALLAAGSHLKHVHLANPAAKRTYPMDDSESDYASFFRVLKRIGYRGGLSVHASTSSFATDAPRAIGFLRTCGRRLAGIE